MTVMAGDVLVMRGPAGSFKTELGLYFLFGSDHHRGTATSSSLFVAARDNEYTIQDTLRRNTPSSSNLAKPIRICALPKGYVDPGYILRTIEKEFDRAQLENEPIDRVLVDDVSYWDMSCPLVRADPAFGDTLVELVRRRGATGLFICGEVSEEMESTVQRPVVNNADCEIVLTRFMYHGIDRVNLRVLKTRGMRHLRESYEVTFDPRSSEVVVRRNSSLLRLSATGEVEQIKVRLFLHAENQAQIDYNSQIQHYLQSVLSRDAEIETETWIDIGDVGRLSASSAVNELQVLHVDEFQLTSASRIPQETRALYEFPNVLWGEEREWKDFVPRLTENIDRGGGNFVAVPFYENISLLAFRENKVDRGILKDWEKLAKACAEWEAEDADSLFFEFPRGTAENYNCLFIEILLSLAQPTIWQNFRCQLVKWLCSDKAIAAAVIYRRLCRRAYTKAKLKDRNRGGFRQAAPPVDVSVNPDAVVWRHWYNTLAQMMENPELQDPFGIKVVALPGGFTIAGEWYLALPAYSAAPDVGLEIIKQMTTREAEMERLQLGIGLPTRQTYYLSGGDHALPESPLSSNMEMSMDELHTLISTAFQRSAFGCYPKASRIIARALQRIIEIPDMEEDAIIEGIARILQNLEASINFLLRDESCADCYIHSRKPTIPRVTAP
jgi:ABC-type glycerol-3-phosphate transport system substrate-binding protein